MRALFFRRLVTIVTLSFVALLLVAASSRATNMVFSITATGLKEVNASGVPNQGDPDGFANGTLTLDSGTTGNTGFATFNLTIGNLAVPLSGFHIHQAPATTTGAIVLDFGNPETFRTGNTITGTTPANLSSTTINSVFANPSGFYFNIHNGTFLGGAVRDQLVPVPEPASLTFLAAGAIGLLVRRRRG